MKVLALMLALAVLPQQALASVKAYQVTVGPDDYYQWFTTPMPDALKKKHPWCRDSIGWVDNMSSYNEIAGCVKVVDNGIVIQLFRPNHDFSRPFTVRYIDKRYISESN